MAKRKAVKKSPKKVVKQGKKKLARAAKASSNGKPKKKKKKKAAAAKAPAAKVVAKKSPAKKSPLKKKAGKKSPAKSAAKKTPSAKSAPVASTPKAERFTRLPIPQSLPGDDFLPQWFGGYGLTQCFCNLNIGTVAELRKTSEEQILETCGQQELGRLKARLDLLGRSAGTMNAPKDDLRTPTENFGYFLRGGNVSSGGAEKAAEHHVCEILARRGTDQVLVRLGSQLAGRWQQVTVPIDRLELLSRADRRRQLQAQTPLDLAAQTTSYNLKLTSEADPVEAILEFEFTQALKTSDAKRRVLIIDDDWDIVESMKTVLEEEGYEVHSGYDANTGLAKALRERPDLLILDLMLPGGGFALFEALRDNYQMPRVIMITGSSEPKNRITAMEMGVDGFLQKPFELDALMEVVRQVLA